MHYQILRTTFDLTQNSLKINANEIECPAKILQALTLFLESRNETISKEHLIKELWGDLIVSDDSLFKVIQCVRKIFKENKLDGVLVNVYGKGYKIKGPIEKHKDREFEVIKEVGKSSFHKKKTTFLFFFSLLVLAITVYFSTVKKPKTVLDTKTYLAYKAKIRVNPKAFLSSIDTQYKPNELNEKSKIDIYSLKAYAHFALGHYEELFDYAQKAIEIAGDSQSLAIADDYHYMAKVYYYRANGDKSAFYVNKSYQIYKSLDDLDGMFKSQYTILNLRYLAKEYELEFSDAQAVFDQAEKKNHAIGKTFALLHMYYASTELDRNEGSEKYALQALEIALEAKDKDLISLSYGILATDNMEKGQYIKAMKRSNEVLKYAVSQPNTNLFMQGFSYMYNILSPLGYDEMAEKYLQKGIDLQAHLNSEGHIHEAEINLGILKIKLGKYKQAQIIFSQLSTYKLSVIDRVRVQAWIAINQVSIHDNIAAYATAKETFYNKDSPMRVKFIAGIAFVIAANELERIKESRDVFTQLNLMANDKWLIEYQLFLDMAKTVANDDLDSLKLYQDKQAAFDEKIEVIRQEAIPNHDTLKELDIYLERVLSE